ncbi:MAG: hypothetical protein LUG99_02285, partial [Lachnospiraceae bacterium]|nr:hypothetical protein [Lachnospiraceae bacterium]
IIIFLQNRFVNCISAIFIAFADLQLVYIVNLGIFSFCYAFSIFKSFNTTESHNEKKWGQSNASLASPCPHHLTAYQSPTS